MPDTKPAMLRNLRVKRVALVDIGANFDKSTGDGAHIMLFKRDSAGGTAIPKEPSPIKESIVKQSFIQKLLGIVTETDVEKRNAAAAALEKEFPPEDDKPVHKADDAMCKCADCVSMRATNKSAEVKALEKRAEDIEKANGELRKVNDDLQKTVAAQIEKSEKAEISTVLKSFKRTSVNLDTDVDVFYKMRKADSAAYDRTIAIMKAADAQLESSALYTNVGSQRDGQAGSAWSQIETLAKGIVEKDAAGMTLEQALDKVMTDPANNRLIKQYRAEQQ